MLAVSGCASSLETRKEPVAGPEAPKQEVEARTAVAGSFLGAFAPDSVGEYTGEKARSKDETARKYRGKISKGILTRVESVSVSPQKARAGEKVDLKMTYAILGAPARKEFTVVETREIRYKGKLLGKFKAYVSHGDGTYSSSVPVILPAGAQKGKYQVVLTVKTHEASASKETIFYVN
jgi:hypothetical protein